MLVDPKTFRLKTTSDSAFIVFEGGNGVGKSTLLKNVAAFLGAQNKEVVTTREPGGTGLGGAIRTLVKERSDVAIDETAELLLFCADRAQHVQELIKPTLKRGAWVCCDRHYFSTLAFQGYGRGMSLDRINAGIELSLAGHAPDLTVVVDLPIEEAKKRMIAREKQLPASAVETDRFEDEASQFQERVRQGFLELAQNRQEPCLILNGMEPVETLTAQLISVLKH